MGFPSPAMDYQESRLSLDSYCKTGRPGVFLFRSDCTSFREGIRQGSLLIVDFGGTCGILPRLTTQSHHA